MVNHGGNQKTRKRQSGKLTYFYLNGKLHKSLHINRSADRIITWCYPDRRRVVYTYSDTKKNREPCFRTREVCEMIMRGRTIVESAITNGNIRAPQYSHPIGGDPNKFKEYKWHEDNIMELHAYLSTVHRGRPRQDGLVRPQAMPSARELRAMIRQEEVLYVRDEDGEFKPVWAAPDFS